MIKEVNSQSIEATQALAESIGARLRGGEVIELVSDLGGGKTTFVHGLARGIQSPDAVASPTFTISRIYKGGKLELHHFDFYRLQDARLIEHELHDVVGDPDIVIAVEWADVVTHVLPEKRVRITFQRTGDDTRKLTVDYPEELAYAVEAIK